MNVLKHYEITVTNTLFQSKRKSALHMFHQMKHSDVFFHLYLEEYINELGSQLNTYLFRIPFNRSTRGFYPSSDFIQYFTI